MAFHGLTVEHFCVEFGDSSCSGFWHISSKSRRINTQTNAGENPTPPATAVSVGKDEDDAKTDHDGSCGDMIRRNARHNGAHCAALVPVLVPCLAAVTSASANHLRLWHLWPVEGWYDIILRPKHPCIEIEFHVALMEKCVMTRHCKFKTIELKLFLRRVCQMRDDFYHSFAILIMNTIHDTIRYTYGRWKAVEMASLV